MRCQCDVSERRRVTTEVLCSKCAAMLEKARERKRLLLFPTDAELAVSERMHRIATERERNNMGQFVKKDSA